MVPSSNSRFSLFPFFRPASTIEETRACCKKKSRKSFPRRKRAAAILPARLDSKPSVVPFHYFFAFLGGMKRVETSLVYGHAACGRDRAVRLRPGCRRQVGMAVREG